MEAYARIALSRFPPLRPDRRAEPLRREVRRRSLPRERHGDARQPRRLGRAPDPPQLPPRVDEAGAHTPVIVTYWHINAQLKDLLIRQGFQLVHLEIPEILGGGIMEAYERILPIPRASG